MLQALLMSIIPSMIAMSFAFTTGKRSSAVVLQLDAILEMRCVCCVVVLYCYFPVMHLFTFLLCVYVHTCVKKGFFLFSNEFSKYLSLYILWYDDKVYKLNIFKDWLTKYKFAILRLNSS